MTLTARPTPPRPMRRHGQATITRGRNPVNEPSDTIGTLHVSGGRGGYVGYTTLTTESAATLRQELDALLSCTPATEGGSPDAR